MDHDSVLLGRWIMAVYCAADGSWLCIEGQMNHGYVLWGRWIMAVYYGADGSWQCTEGRQIMAVYCEADIYVK